MLKTPSRFTKAIFALAFIFSFVNFSFAQPEGFQLKKQALAPNLYAITANNSQSTVNMIAYENGNFWLLSDVLFPPLGEQVKATLGNNLPVQYIINTHYHGDHSGGNIFYPAASVIAHENTRENLTNGAMYGPEPALEDSDLPAITFQDKMTLRFGEERIEMEHLANGHTNGDIIVHFTKSNVLHIGDILLDAKALPFTSDPEALQLVLERILEIADAETKIVPGHGRILLAQDVQDVWEILEVTIAYVKKGIRKKKSAAQLTANYPQDWKEWNSRYQSIETWIGNLHKKYSSDKKK